MAKTKKIPDWALKHKVKGTQINRVKDRYYLYKVSSKWDPEKKRAQKITEEYLGKITPEGLIPPKHKRNKLIDLKKDDKVLKKLQILQDLNENKDKKDLAKTYGVSVKTISNIEKRFEEEGVKGLIHTRKSSVETVKVSTSEQAAIITAFVQNPNKTVKEIKKEVTTKLSLSEMKKLLSPLIESIKLKKKIILEIE